MDSHISAAEYDDQFAPSSLKLHESIENAEWNKNMPNISINQSCSNHITHFQVCFKKTLQWHSTNSELISHSSCRLYHGKGHQDIK